MKIEKIDCYMMGIAKDLCYMRVMTPDPDKDTAWLMLTEDGLVPLTDLVCDALEAMFQANLGEKSDENSQSN